MQGTKINVPIMSSRAICSLRVRLAFFGGGVSRMKSRMIIVNPPMGRLM